MAEAIAFMQFLIDRNVPQDVCLPLQTNGITVSSDLSGLACNTTGMDNLFKQIKEPGGTIPNPDAGVAGQPALLWNPGVQVPFNLQTLIAHIAFYAVHCFFHLQLPFTAANATEARINHAYEFEDTYLQHKDDTVALLDKLDTKKLKISLDALTECFGVKYGDIDIPLSYVI